jgi:hypothetical protein
VRVEQLALGELRDAPRDPGYLIDVMGGHCYTLTNPTYVAPGQQALESWQRSSRFTGGRVYPLSQWVEYVLSGAPPTIQVPIGLGTGPLTKTELSRCSW